MTDKTAELRHLLRLVDALKERGVTSLELHADGGVAKIGFAPVSPDAPVAQTSSPETAVTRRKLELKDPETIDAIIKARLMGSH